VSYRIIKANVNLWFDCHLWKR